ncbi:DUF3592 domain-containing protein [Marinifilum caeruleilacunae]|uniref:DUF3592 domain-containing protein n=1 Tax=Marinifilum caeruleilacunae TaxID=2499076 RepID=A0ABX1WVP1_9BACT|nr:DUF3592 domain-containing protein [Marinifilum caeruleilacunae]NOU60127.1 DUF3592 domain-containing protein [Marinifilum caeruleilacunae]
MKISGFRCILITVLILLIPIYGNWRLFLQGEKAEGVVIRISKDSISGIYSIYSIIRYEVEGEHYRIKGLENVEYPIGKKFTILYHPDNPQDAILYNLKGVYFNRMTSVAIVLFVLWVAFYLSFTPKSEKRKSEQERFKTNGKFSHHKLN